MDMRSAIAALVVLAVVAVIITVVALRKSREGFESRSMRPCSVFFTENVDACNHPTNVYKLSDFDFTKRYEGLVNRGSQRTSAEEEELNALKAVERDRASALVPMGGKVCKMTFKDWEEPVDSPVKIAGAASEPRGPPEHWAFCFRRGVNKEETERIATEFGNKGAVAFDTYTDEGEPYARIKFNTLAFNDIQKAYCQSEPPSTLPSDIPILIGFDQFNMVAQRVSVYERNVKSGGSSLIELSGSSEDMKSLYAGFFGLQQSGRKYMYGPKVVTGTVYVLDINECGRAHVIRTEPIAFSLGTMGVTPKVLVDNIASIGKQGNIINMKQIVAKYESLMTELQNKRKEIAALAGGGAGGASSTPIYKQGLLRSNYNIPNIYRHRNYWIGGPTVNNRADVSALMVPENLNSQVVDVNIPYLTSADPHEYLRVWDGFIRIDVAGEYLFKISTDDAGDLTINDVLVAHHYGYHGADDNGVSAQWVQLSAGYHKVQLRVFEWHGGHGVRYIHWRRRSSPTFTHVPAANFVYDANSPNVQDALSGITSINQSLTVLKPYYDAAKQDTSVHIPALMSQVTGKNLSKVFNKSHVSQDGRIYIALGANQAIESIQVMQDEPWNNTERQKLLDPVTNIANTPLSLNTPDINFGVVPVYTISLWLKIDQGFNKWRNVFYLGEKEMDRTPALWIYPDNTMRLHFRHHSSHWNNWGVDVTNLSTLPRFGEWFHYAAVANRNKVDVYINGKLAASGSTPGNNTLVWNAGTNFGERKRFYMNLAESYPDQNGGMHVQKVSWFNRALVQSEISDLAKEVQVKYVTGRYVRLQRKTWPPGGAGQGYINILELTANGPNDQPLSAKPSLWPQYGSSGVFGPQYLVDRNIRSDWWASRSGTGLPHTTNHPNSYVELDLEAMKEIRSLVIENRRDCCTSRIIGTELQVLDNERRVIWSKMITNDQPTYRYPLDL